MLPIVNYIAILFVVNLKLYEAKYGDACMTPSVTSGQCVPVRSCSSALNNLSSDDNVREVDASFLRQNSCGQFNNVDHICCPKDDIILNFEGLEILNKTECGHFQIPKVAIGQEVELFTFPWLALLKYNDRTTFMCRATLISHRYVLTAGQCVRNQARLPIAVRLGEHNITSERDCQGFGESVRCAPPIEDVGIEEIILHQHNARLLNDIALIRLNRRVDFKEHIKAICLPISEELRTNYPSEYLFASFGHTSDYMPSDVLTYDVLPHKDLSVCKDVLNQENLTSMHICAGGDIHESCNGDGGGPIAQTSMYNGQLRLVQYGIVSFGDRCGGSGFPGVYTNVSYHMQWITDHIRDD